MLWEIIQRSTVGARAAATALRTRIYGAEQLIMDQEYDIKGFNTEIENILHQLQT